MVMKLTVQPVPKHAASLEIPDEVRDDLEEVYAALSAQPNHEAHAAFDTEDEKKLFIRMARKYADTREAGALTFRIKPSKNLPVTEIRFQLTTRVAESPENDAANAAAAK
jgi:hypothetical protein